jgi:hypothetical protein
LKLETNQAATKLPQKNNTTTRKRWETKEGGIGGGGVRESEKKDQKKIRRKKTNLNFQDVKENPSKERNQIMKLKRSNNWLALLPTVFTCS